MLTRGLMVFHISLASITKTPELILEEAEATGLSESALTLMSLYDIRPDPKVEAAIMFAGQMGLVYGTRFVAIRARLAKEKAERASKGSATVIAPDGSPAGETTAFSWPIEASAHPAN